MQIRQFIYSAAGHIMAHEKPMTADCQALPSRYCNMLKRAVTYHSVHAALYRTVMHCTALYIYTITYCTRLCYIAPHYTAMY